MIDIEENLGKEENCLFFKKGKTRSNRKRPLSESEEEDEVQIVRPTKAASFNPLKQLTKQVNKHLQANISDDEENKVSVSYKSTKNEKPEGPTDRGATMESQIDTDIAQDAQTIHQKAVEINKSLKGKQDDKIYRGINNYTQYIEKKDTILGNASSNLVRKGPMRAPAFIRSTTRWDFQPDLCKDYQETGYCVFGDSCKFGHDRTDYKFGWQLEQEWKEGKYGEDSESRKYEILAEVLTHGGDDDSDTESTNNRKKLDQNADLPFRCFICRRSFKDPVVTKCKHYFCEQCALKRYKGNTRCFVCGAQTHGIFAPAKEITAKLKASKAGGTTKSGDADSTSSSDSESDIENNHKNEPGFTSQNFIGD